MELKRISPLAVVGLSVVLGATRFAQAQVAEAPSAPATTRPVVETALPIPLEWTASDIIVGPDQDPAREIVSIKDPTIVRYNDRWHIYATTANKRGQWQMVYLNFADWSEAKTAKQFHLSDNPVMRGYHCAPNLFYFRPHKKWYLVYQSQHPQYSTTDDLSDPMSWTAPQNFFEGKPKVVGDSLWIDYWVICDDTHAYLFFTGDNGKLYRSRTTIEEFPKGMSDPVVVMEEEGRFDLFEGSATYKIKGTDQYLTIVEAIGPGGIRYYRSWVADRLDGEWTPLADTWDEPFAGPKNVTFAEGVQPWTEDISHGELIRDGYDETMTIDPANLKFLFQGRAPSRERIEYSQLPYRIGLLTPKPADASNDE